MDRRKFLLTSLLSSALYAAGGEVRYASADVDAGPSLDPLPEPLQQKLAHDTLRPQFHLLPRHNWMNDPCAPRFHHGQYHMFFQYNPNAAVWGDMHWNHATSPDMIHWKHQPVVLAPGPNSFDSFGIFTGSVLPDADVPTILYTGVSRSSPDLETIRGEGTREVQCLATSTDPDLRVWKKLDKPVITAPPDGAKVTGFRDPCPWKDGDTWYLGVGSGFDRVGGAVLLYTSKDGHNWTYLHPLAQGKWNGGMETNPVDTGEMWECPDFFPLSGKHVLLYSTERKVYWNVGVFDKHDLRFHVETTGLLDQGAYYAMKSMPDATGRRILWGWVTEKRDEAALTEAGWAGCMALPRLLSIGSDNRLRMEIVPEFASLRRDTRSFIRREGQSETASVWLAKETIRDRSAHLLCTFRPDETSWTLALSAVDANAPLLSIRYDGDPTHPVITVAEKVLTLVPAEDGTSSIELWFDGSVAEVFVDKKEAMTARIYTLSRGDLHFAWKGPSQSVLSMSVSKVTSISADRLTT